MEQSYAMKQTRVTMCRTEDTRYFVEHATLSVNYDFTALFFF